MLLEGTEERVPAELGLGERGARKPAEEARGLTETYVLNVEGDVFTARIVDGSLEVSMGAAEDADLVVEVDMGTFFELAGGELELRNAVKRGQARVEGDAAARDRCFRVLSLAPRVSAAA